MDTATSFFSQEIVQDFYRPDGPAKVTFEWGSFEGTFVSGRANGYGVQYIRRRPIPGGLPSQEAEVYRGDWREGKREGYGRLEIPWEDKVYEGGWINGRASGFGRTFKMKAGWATEWEEHGFKEGIKYGWGIHCIHGIGGEVIWRSGGFKDGEKYGYSIKASGKTEEYSSIKRGQVHGYYTTRVAGVVQNRDFYLDGRKVAQPRTQIPAEWLPSMVYFDAASALFRSPTHHVSGSATTQSGDTYLGNLSYGMPHGYGVLNLSRAHRKSGTYEGGFKHGFACGYGVWLCLDGTTYAGGWLHGKPFGFGKLTLMGSGETFEVFWEDGVGWRFESTLNLMPLNVPDFRSPSPIPFQFQRTWEL